ncbi:MAG: molybdopterin-dependent oxidoreductase [Acetobacteraceae bacterium]
MDRRTPAVTAGDVAPELARLRRRGLLKHGLSLGSLALLTGCDLSTHSGVDAALWTMLRFNDRVQAALFHRTRLAETYPASAVTRPYRFNAYYPEWQVLGVPAGWCLDVSGRVADRTPWTLQRLLALPREKQITRHICIEGWSQIGEWSGVPLHVFLRRVGADLRARYVAFKCFDGYSTSLDMPSALHPQTMLAVDFEGAPLAPEWGAPLRLRIPIKLGFKSAKNLQAIEVTDTYPGGYWENQGYNWFSGS